jgi:thermolysin
MKKKGIFKVMGGGVLALIIAMPSYSFALEPTNSLSATEKAMSESSIVAGKVKPAKDLQKISMRNLHVPIQGLVAEGASFVAQSILNTGSFDVTKSIIPDKSIGSRDSISTATIVRSRVDKTGKAHIRMAQKYRGLRVIGAEFVVHVNELNNVYQINGKYLPDLNISTSPSISTDASLQIGLDEQQGNASLNVSHDPELVIYAGRLAYFYIIEYERPAIGQWYYYVDAQTGSVLNSYDNIQYGPPTSGDGSHQTISGSRLSGEDGSVVTMQGWYDNPTGNYFMMNFNELWTIGDADAGNDWEQQASSNWGTSDRAAVSAGNNFEAIQGFVSDVMSMNSFNDAGAEAIAIVHEGTDYVNAYWNGSAFYFGDGDGVNANPLSVLDVAAHEYGHALTDYSSDLVYQYESGALNEAYSDIFGTTVEFWIQPDGTSSYPSSIPGRADWLMGEDAWLAGEALRNLRDPLSYSYPSYYLGTYWHWDDTDDGGVHTNCMPLEFAFYLLTEGGSGTNDGHAYNVTGVGLEKAAETAMAANLSYHTSTDDYPDARQAWIDSATDRDFDVSAVKAAFKAIGVGELWEQNISGVNTNAYADQDFETANDDADIFIADDFVCSVPWEIQMIYVPGRFWSGGTTLANASALHFAIYGNAGGVPDGYPGGGNAPLWSLSVSPSNTQITLLDNEDVQPGDVLLNLATPVNLAAGTYWLVFYPEMDYTAGFGQYGRVPSDTLYGYTAQVINPGGAIFPVATSWIPVTSASAYNITQQDFAFVINYFTPIAGGLGFNASAFSVGESSGTATITVTRTNGDYGAVSINYATSDGTATSGSDYTAASGTLNWADDDASSKTFTVAITDDTDAEGAETITLTLSTPAGGASFGAISSAILTITANDGGGGGDSTGGGGGGGGGGCFIAILGSD